MGFQPGLKSDTFFLLTANRIIPIQFVANQMRKHPERPIVERLGTNSMMWAVREIAENTLAVGFNGEGRF